eukprot:gene3858-13921_t
MSSSPCFSTGALSWFRCSPQQGSSSLGCQPPPVVVLLTWMWAKPGPVLKFVNLYREMGFDVAVYRTPALSVWSPPMALSNARQILSEVQMELEAHGPRPLVFAAFSGASKASPMSAVYYKILPLLNASCPQSSAPGSAAEGVASSTLRTPTIASLQFPLVSKCFAGQIFDSGPVDFTSEAGVRLISPPPDSNEAVVTSYGRKLADLVKHQAGLLAAGTLDFFLLEIFDKQKSEMWHVLQTSGAQTAMPVTTADSASATNAQSTTNHQPTTNQQQPTTRQQPTTNTDNVQSNSSAANRSTTSLEKMQSYFKFPSPSAPAATPILHSSPAHLDPAAQKHPPPPPTLFLYSWNDPLAEAYKIHGLAKELRCAGGQVIEQSWGEGRHMSHYKNHPEAYKSVTRFFLGELVLPAAALASSTAVRQRPVAAQGPSPQRESEQQQQHPTQQQARDHATQAEATQPSTDSPSSSQSQGTEGPHVPRPHSGLVSAYMASAGAIAAHAMHLHSAVTPLAGAGAGSGAPIATIARGRPPAAAENTLGKLTTTGRPAVLSKL